MNIGLDMMGGDFAPLEAVKGAADFIASTTNTAIHLTLIGDESKIREHLADHPIAAGRYSIVHAAQVIGMHEHPTKALKEKQQSSIAIGFHLLATGKTDAFISAGNTGAMMVGSLFSIKAIEGVLRPTIGAYMPREDGSLGLLVDVGLNADCKPENLNQFAILGSLFAKHILNFENPKVGLVNLGEEEGKGNILAQATYPLLKANKQINFTGNIEGRDILLNKADVLVCEGFTGNVVLKLAESIYDIVKRRDIHDEHFDRFNFEQYGGVPVLGVAKPVIIGHGISHALAFKNMIRIASRMLEIDLMGKMKNSFLEQA
ncbi:MAG TPA: phosphate acyltransferase PlsX [Ferruginibacter sp.]|nr:phosphate acyltransferase PlsX [Ferruginibacter sp.]HMW25266.1 phosphate acyltransferase PlsX [Ferruginibacter sp.]HMX79218.1 phosphate acyltransferase PlsX [Ferruginibacter sp.]HMZ99573.1 phosphate acyltransferase PlsX [Ferruginibacter sp.]HNF01658.1 phosphate acyltransferase PlsX [Ferruginibacter sp.]